MAEGASDTPGDKAKSGSWMKGVESQEAPYSYTTESGEKYDVTSACFKYGKKIETGTISFSNGDVYEGDWSMGAKNGKGVYKCSNGVVYDGRWKDDMRHGYGTCTYANGDEYKGKWAKNQKHGDGIYTFHNGNRYDGDWRSDRACGKGKCEYANKDKYEGDWKDDRAHGQGTYTYSTGEEYKGAWVKGKKCGMGTFKFQCGDMYDGEFKDDDIQGKGTKRFANGDVYVGDWVRGLRHGKGKQEYKDGTPTYDGQWRDDAPYTSEADKAKMEKKKQEEEAARKKKEEADAEKAKKEKARRDALEAAAKAKLEKEKALLQSAEERARKFQEEAEEKARAELAAAKFKELEMKEKEKERRRKERAEREEQERIAFEERMLKEAERRAQAEQEMKRAMAEKQMAKEEEEKRRREEEEEAERKRKQDEADALKAVQKGFLNKGGKKSMQPVAAPEVGGQAAQGSSLEDGKGVEERGEMKRVLIEEVDEDEEKAGEGKAGTEVEEKEGGAPPLNFRQNEQNVTMIVRVSGVDESSVDLRYTKTKVMLHFAANTKEGRVRYRHTVHTFGDIEPLHCRHDVSGTNMVVVLRKAEMDKWATFVGSERSDVPPPTPAAASKEEKSDGKGKESKEEGGKGAGKHANQVDEAKPAEVALASSGKEEEEEKKEGAADDENFCASKVFKGSREGFVFKMGERGLGYYRDTYVRPAGLANMEDEEKENIGGAEVRDAVEEAKKAQADGVMDAYKQALPKLGFANNLMFELD